MIEETAVPTVKLIRLPLVCEARGNLTFGEYDAHLPFVPLRYFLIYGVPAGVRRGGHAHRQLQQALVCVQGAVAVEIDDGRRRDEIILDSPVRALIVPPLVWATQTFAEGAMLLVLCSDRYDAADYISDYAEFVGLVKTQR
ncbi:MAG TPA: FdtA/QdtA family cupin domain-containing protein [Blastocatellia bacterium]|nr:FdtA/QdtA family cupin domain-containing protein [Blastocatellia bacterium]